MTYLTSVANGVADTGSTQHDSNSLTVSGTNKVMWAAVPMSDGSPVAPTGLVWDPAGSAQALTKTNDSGTFGGFANFSLWRLVAPANATSFVRSTYGAAVGERSIIVWVETDIDQTTPNGTVATGTGTGSSVSTSAVSTSAGQRVLNFGHALSTSVFSGPTEFDSPSGTERQDGVTSGTAYDAFAAQEQTAGGSSVTPTWSLNQGVDGWFSMAFALNVAGAPAPASAPPKVKTASARMTTLSHF